ncbi:phage terminase small subunit [Sphingobacterium lactis]|uniref:Phage terminase small subunit n=1 Tax=Sphingobacterium lactis TaxID=797291 RepID=A0A1H6CSN7_9SPHI|nr:phage terminase small subunit [Sphingobacterium lactis]
MALTDKQQRFVEEYMVDLNATQAAIRAGYSQNTAHSIGAENLIKPEIQEAIQKRKQELSDQTGITAERVLKEYAKIAFSDIRELYTPDNNLYDIRQLDDETAGAVMSVEVDVMSVQGMPVGETKKVKLYNKLTALEALGKHIGLFEKDNKQKQAEVQNIINLGSGVKPKEDE